MAQRPGALERARYVLADWRSTKTRLTQVESRMVEVLDELGLTELVTSIPGVSAVGAAAMLADTGDPAALIAPRAGQTRRARPARQQQRHLQGPVEISRRGRPRLRLAAWRATWAPCTTTR